MADWIIEHNESVQEARKYLGPIGWTPHLKQAMRFRAEYEARQHADADAKLAGHVRIMAHTIQDVNDRNAGITTEYSPFST